MWSRHGIERWRLFEDFRICDVINLSERSGEASGRVLSGRLASGIDAFFEGCLLLEAMFGSYRSHCSISRRFGRCMLTGRKVVAPRSLSRDFLTYAAFTM